MAASEMAVSEKSAAEALSRVIRQEMTKRASAR